MFQEDQTNKIIDTSFQLRDYNFGFESQRQVQNYNNFDNVQPDQFFYGYGAFIPKQNPQPQQEEIEPASKSLVVQKLAWDQQISQSQILQQEDEYIPKSQRLKDKQKKIAKKQTHPTNNFLPTFRSAILNYIQKHYSGNFLQVPIVKKLKKTNCINMEDYIELFKYPAFRPILRQYFANRVIFRDLMQSRASFRLKKIYILKIDVFYKVFRTGRFERINEK